MSFTKRFLEERFARGFSSIDKYVCAECFEDNAINDFICNNATESECDYCGRKSDEPIAAHMDAVMEFIMEGIWSEWESPNESVGWEGGWVGATVIDSYDLIFDDELELGIDNEELKGDIFNSLDGTQWCKRDPYGLSEDEELIYDWKEFSKQVKNRIRYVFYKVNKKPSKYDVIKRHNNPYEILETIGAMLRDLRLIRTLPAGSIVFRSRMHKRGKGYKTLKDLAPPSEDNAIYSNRMSPAGIPMFYCALSEDTAISEVSHNSDRKYATIAQFEIMRPFKVLDLSIIPRVPSLFDRDKRKYRAAIIFLRDFLWDLTKPIEKNGLEHIEYVPTQVVTEYLRHIFSIRYTRLDGILYPSSCHKGGISCVFFYTKEDCVDDTIKLSDVDKPFHLISSSTKEVRVR